MAVSEAVEELSLRESTDGLKKDRLVWHYPCGVGTGSLKNTPPPSDTSPQCAYLSPVDGTVDPLKSDNLKLYNVYSATMGVGA